jgi:hypothetical protein
MTWVVRLLLLSLSALLASAAPAWSAPVGHTPRHVEAGPLVTAGGVATMEVLGSTRLVRFYASGRGRTLKRAGVVPAPPDDENDLSGEYSSEDARVAASAGTVAFSTARTVGNAKYQQGTRSSAVFAGSAGSGLGGIASCSGDVQDRSLTTSAALAVDSNRVAYVNCAGRIVVREGASSVLAPAGLGVERLSLAGDLLAAASSAGGPVRVVNWRTGTTIYETGPITPAAFDLQPDGVLAVVDDVATGRDECQRLELGWYSPAEPTRHRMRIAPCTSEVSLAAGRMVVVASLGAGKARSLVSVGLAGDVREHARVAELSMLSGGTDSDGSSYSVGVASCRGGTDLRRGPLSAPVERVGRSCPFRFTSAPKRTAKGVRITARCSLGCSGVISLTARLGSRPRSVSLGRARFSAAPTVARCGKGARLAVRLSKRGRRALASRGSLRATLTASVRDRAGADRRFRRKMRLARSGLAAGMALEPPRC